MRENLARLDQATSRRSLTGNVMPDYSVGQLRVDNLGITTPSGTKK